MLTDEKCPSENGFIIILKECLIREAVHRRASRVEHYSTSYEPISPSHDVSVNISFVTAPFQSINELKD